MGEIDDKPQRSWVSSDDDSQHRCYLGMKGRVTVADLVSHFHQHYPHVNPGDIQLNFATAVWEEPPTPEDLAKREAWRVEKAQRLEQWERDTYIRLKAKFA